MSIGIILITHSGIGRELLKTAINTFEELPLDVIHLPVNQNVTIEYLVGRARNLMNKFSHKDGILILTDMYGATPHNIAAKLAPFPIPVKMITGLNLPMLIRVLNYPKLNLPDLAWKALSGGREGVLDSSTCWQPPISQAQS